MKVKVMKEFIDKYTQEFHEVGEVITLTDDRFAEITKVGQYIEVFDNKGQAEPSGSTEQPGKTEPSGSTEQPKKMRTSKK